MKQTLDSIKPQLSAVMLRDKHQLSRQWHILYRTASPDHKKTKELVMRISASAKRAASRKQNRPHPTFKADLPVIGKRDVIAKAISAHQVIILCGETGSGKTTQLPKICLDLGRGITGLIGHTQPRRIAARTVATRIAEELGGELGGVVGYKVRFHDSVDPLHSYVKLMTDGILLAETQTDKFLNQYDTIIIDEAHERSLNIDFLLGYLKQILPKRPDLKVIITSATIDTKRFSEHFSNAPIIEVSGRSYPVEMRYRPLKSNDEESTDTAFVEGIADAVTELCHEGRGDILVFLSGERDIRDVSDVLRRQHPNNTDILPLLARQSTSEQNRVFKTGGNRRIILATNVAETSLTVPGIRYVVDPGLARISRYSVRNKVQRLPIEKISQSSANQRAGRCGRVAAGICIRLYDEDDFKQRDEFTDPEILRTNLASVILQMAAYRLGEPEKFPFINPPPAKMINDGYRLLEELGAVGDQRNLTDMGRKLAKLPIDPRIGRMILAANTQQCLTEVLIIASALSVQDPRERPMDKQKQADDAHARYKDERSDFLMFLSIWTHFEKKKAELSQNKLRRYCKENFLSYLRIREWQDIHRQLQTHMVEMGFKSSTQAASYQSIHTALLTGLLSHIATKTDNREYTGARNLKLAIFPGSALHKKGPKWMMAAELVETGKLYARIVAKIEPEWIEPVAKHLVRRQHTDPHWERKPAQVVALEQVTLYGLAIINQKRVHYGSIYPIEAREIFIRAALVAGDWDCRAPFFRHNQTLISEIEALENKSRRRDVLVDDEVLFDFYQQRIPKDIVNGAGFLHWYKTAQKQDSKSLFLYRENLMQHTADHVTVDMFPDKIQVNRIEMPLAYDFAPGEQRDGVTQTIPLSLLNQTEATQHEWLVPGLLRDKVIFLLKNLPKNQRRSFIPVPQFADRCLAQLSPASGALLPALSACVYSLAKVNIPITSWDEDSLPPYLKMNFKLVDEKNKVLDESRDLVQLKKDWGDKAQASFSNIPGSDFEKSGLTTWDFGGFPAQLTLDPNGSQITAYPALLDHGTSVDLVLRDTAEQAALLTQHGLRRLFMLAQVDTVKYLRKNLPNITQMCLYYSNVPPSPFIDEIKDKSTTTPSEQLKTDIIALAVERCFIADLPAIRDAESFKQRLSERRSDFIDIASELAKQLASPLAAYHHVAKRLTAGLPLTALDSIKDIKQQLNHLIYQGVVHDISTARLARLPVYFKALDYRLDKLAENISRDKQRMTEMMPHWQRYLNAPRHTESLNLIEYRWLVEEFRISLFAQGIKTSQPVSGKRLDKLWEKC